MIPPFQVKPTRRLNYTERRRAGLVKVKPRQRVKPVSRKRKTEAAEYASLRKFFLVAHPVCQFPGCACCDGLEIHHKARRGRFYLRTDTWMVVCRPHHDQIEKNPEWSKANGYLLTPEQRRLIANPNHPQPFTLLPR